MVKWDARIFDRSRAAEEIRYLDTNPHEAWIREVFRLARIEYGRVDYGILAGKPQVWEINTNSTIGRPPGPIVPYRPDIAFYKEQLVAPEYARFYENFGAAWAALDCPSDGATIAMAAPPALLRAIDDAERRQRRSERVDSLLSVLARQSWVRPLASAAKRGLASLALARLRRNS
jgi:hypothetical protein